MKFKRILSSALLAVMIFTLLVAAFPMAISAVYLNENETSGSTATADLDSGELAEYLEEYLEYNYETAEEMLKDELAAGYLYSVNSNNKQYSIYVNKYTGFLYYKNNVTGQILTSNPTDPGSIGSINREEVMSQIQIKFYESANQTATDSYFSYKWAASLSQINVSPIQNGLRVSYTLGDTTPRYLLPGRITAENYKKYIYIPMINAFEDLLIELCADKVEEGTNLKFFDNELYENYNKYGLINTSSSNGLTAYLNKGLARVSEIYGDTSKEYKALFKINYALNTLPRHYTLQNPQRYEAGDAKLEEMNNKYPITSDGTIIYVYNSERDIDKRIDNNNVKLYCKDYNFTLMYADEKECGYVAPVTNKPVFRCALEYAFNDDGTLTIRLPASSITFDETVYTLEYITPLQYFGAADASDDGYVFFPDGSGAIIKFEDFYRDGVGGKTNVSITASTYGIDYCYSKITGSHRQQTTMPVYGIVNEVEANSATEKLYGKETVMNGFFAVIEEGSALANLGVKFGGASHKYATSYASYTPYPADKYELSDQISVGGASGGYTMVSESKYTGSYITRIVMLTDEEIGDVVYGTDAYYSSDYVGMASYYRNYLKEAGVLSAVQTVSEDLPLYIETLGAMDITAKFLSFPVTKTIPLTTFDDVLTMYNELANCKTLAAERAAENEKLAAETEDIVLKAEYEALAKEYRALEAAVENIKNINFRLTGFANGGMKFTYPVKLRWERACGGSAGYEALIAEANSVSKTEGVNFGVYADFDFMFINNKAMFDGIGNKGNVSKMVDNRYASKQVYNNTIQEYESFFDMVISPDALDRLFAKFDKDFSDYQNNKISLSTMGSIVNSNFDEDNPINREEASEYVSDLLNKITSKGYDVMTDIGNIYSVKYASHILNATIDSSHYRHTSYAVPFIGLVLHSYVNYTGTPLNYTGNVDYDILKSIENGAAPYYLLCYQNSAYLKDDDELNEYYGVSYENWYNDIVKTYAELNLAIGDLQDYELVYHSAVICERVIEDSEMAVNYELLEAEIIELVEAQLISLIDNSFNELAAGGADNYAKRLKLVVDRAALMSQFSEILNLPVETLEARAFAKSLDALIKEYTDEYPGSEAEENNYVVVFDGIEYKSKYSYITDSAAFDKDYVKTAYTIDGGNVTMVKYRKGADEVVFFLNYNNFTVNIRLDSETVISLDKFSYTRIG